MNSNSQSVPLSVVIPTHNPARRVLERVFSGLRCQTLAKSQWELIVVDNSGTDPDYLPGFDLSWHPSSHIIREDRLGLTWARTAGIVASRGEWLVFVDDDNVLDSEYLVRCLKIFEAHPELGAFGGKSVPEFEIPPASWIVEFHSCLALRDLGEQDLISKIPSGAELKEYPAFAPIGAGMCLRREAAGIYLNHFREPGKKLIGDRTGRSLSSGGDNDIVLVLLEHGWQVGYFPALSLTHLIPKERLTREYLSRVNFASSKTWIEVLDKHRIRPWGEIPRWSLPLRKLKAYLTYRAWEDAASYVKWSGACGAFEARAKLTST